MKNETSFTKVGFLKSYLLPVLIMFLIPGFGLWFFNHVESHYDGEIRESLISQIRSDQTLTTEERDRAIHFYERSKVSRMRSMTLFSVSLSLLFFIITKSRPTFSS